MAHLGRWLLSYKEGAELLHVGDISQSLRKTGCFQELRHLKEDVGEVPSSGVNNFTVNYKTKGTQKYAFL